MREDEERREEIVGERETRVRQPPACARMLEGVRGTESTPMKQTGRSKTDKEDETTKRACELRKRIPTALTVASPGGNGERGARGLKDWKRRKS